MLKNWAISFPGIEPLAHKLRAAFADRWVRFHSLPESKRYPESETEYATVLRRFNAILNAMQPKLSPVILLTTEFSFDATPPERSQVSPAAKLWRSVVQDDDWWWHVYATETNWHDGIFDSVIRRVADDEIRNVMICDTHCRWLVHPYDGGMDVVLSSSKERDNLRDLFSGWLSAHPEGL